MNLDGHRPLARHVQKPLRVAAGAPMRIDTDERDGQAVGSMIRMTVACALWLSLEEVVATSEAPQRNV